MSTIIFILIIVAMLDLVEISIRLIGDLRTLSGAIYCFSRVKSGIM